MNAHSLPDAGCEVAFVPGFEHYAADVRGRIWSCKPRRFGIEPTPWRILATYRIGPQQHQGVKLCSGKRPGRLLGVHTIVLWTFRGKAKKGQECRHLDGNPRNNCLSNLAWGTRSENVRDAIRHGTRDFFPPDLNGTNSVCARFTAKQVTCIRELVRLGMKKSYLARQHNCHRNIIYVMCTRRTYRNVP
jgi:hypothetical protein